MADHGRPNKRYFQFGREATYGTAVAATHRFPVLSLTRGARRTLIRSEAKDGTRFRQNAYVTKKSYRPVVELELTYTGLLLLLDGLFGTDTYGANGGATSGVNPYTHVFKMRSIFNSYTLQFGMGDVPTTKVERFEGAKITRATISGASHERLRVRLEFLAEDFSTNVTPTGSLAAPTMDCVLMGHLSSFNDGTGTTGQITGFEFAMENALSERDYAADLIAEPLAGGLADASLRISQEFQSQTAIDAHIAGTTGAPSLTFTSGTKSFAISMPVAYLDEGCEPSDDGDTRMLQDLMWLPISDSGSPTETLLTVTVVNAQSSITA